MWKIGDIATNEYGVCYEILGIVTAKSVGYPYGVHMYDARKLPDGKVVRVPDYLLIPLSVLLDGASPKERRLLGKHLAAVKAKKAN